MASAAFPSGRRMSIGRVFNRGFGALGANAPTMFGIAFLFSALPIAVLNLWQVSTGPTRDFATNTALIGGMGLVSFVLTQLAQGGLVRATIAHMDGRPVTFGECIATGARFAVPLLGLGFLLGICVTIGFALLIIPGIMLYLAWSVAIPATVVERSGIMAAFGRSAFLTRGARWNILAIGLVMLVLYYAMSAVMGVVTVALTGFPGLNQGLSAFATLSTLLTAITTTIATAAAAAIQTSLYVELRDWKDGPAVDLLSDIFA